MSKLSITALTKVHARQMATCGKEDILVNSVSSLSICQGVHYLFILFIYIDSAALVG